MDDNEQAAASAAADQSATPNPKPEDTQQPPEGQAAAPEGDEDDDEGEGGEQDAARKSRSAERREARNRQRDAERAELAFYRQQQAARPQPLTLEERIGAPPNAADFRGDAVSYAAAMAAYRTQRQGAASAMAAEQRQRDAFDAARIQDREARGEALVAAARVSLPDYDRTVQSVAHMTAPQAAVDAIAESDLRPQLMYHLGKNPTLAASLARMTPTQAVKEIGRLEAVLSAASSARSATQAPPPPTSLRGGSSGPARSFADLAKNDDATDAIAVRRAERAKKRA